MSTGTFQPRRKWQGQRRSQITDADLANYGLAGVSMDKSIEIATGRVPGAIRPKPTPSFPKPPAPAAKPPAPAPAPVQTTGRADFWRQVQRVRAAGATKTTTVTAAPGGVVLNVTTRTGQGVAEALVFIPGATLADFAT
jgi:hypothetical protein